MMKGSSLFSSGIDYSLGLLSEVNHSPKVFERLALGRDEVLISHGQWQQPLVLCNLSRKWLYPLCIPSRTARLQAKGSCKSLCWEIPLILVGMHNLSLSPF